MNELERCRAEIDKIDTQMAKLFEERMNICRAVADYKKENALPIYDEARENAILASKASRVSDAELQPYYVDFMKDVMKTSRRYQSALLEGMSPETRVRSVLIRTSIAAAPIGRIALRFAIPVRE